MGTNYQTFDTDKLWKSTHTSSGIFDSITKDKIVLGICAIGLLTIVGAVIDSNYSVGLSKNSINLMPSGHNPLNLGN